MIEEYKAILWIGSGLLFWLIDYIVVKIHGGQIKDNAAVVQALIISLCLGPITFLLFIIAIILDKMKGNK